MDLSILFDKIKENKKTKICINGLEIEFNNFEFCDGILYLFCGECQISIPYEDIDIMY